MFTKRNEPDLDGNPGLQDNLRDAMRDVGGQVLLFGDTGVGKSSLVKYAAEDEERGTLIVECLSNHSYEDLVETAVRKVVEVREVSRTRRGTVESEAEVSGGMPFLMTLRGRLKAGAERGSEFEVVAQSPLDVLLKAMHESKQSLWVLDNFQNIVDPGTRQLVAQTMELMSDRATETGDIKTVVIGIAEDAVSLIGGSGSYRRRTSEIGVPRMPDDEVREIFTTGFNLLGLMAATDILNLLVFYSDGFPYFAHLLGLNVARAARRQAQTHIDANLVEAASKQAVRAVSTVFDAKIAKAVEAGGDVQPRRRILHILASSDQRAWKASDLITDWEKELGDKRERYEFLHVALAQLVSDKHGAVLRRSGTRNKYVYQFADPQMRPYLRLRSI
jgi:Cdc6-like AAA superfamily ATPase